MESGSRPSVGMAPKVKKRSGEYFYRGALTQERNQKSTTGSGPASDFDNRIFRSKLSLLFLTIFGSGMGHGWPGLMPFQRKLFHSKRGTTLWDFCHVDDFPINAGAQASFKPLSIY